MKVKTVEKNIYFCTFSCGERYVALPSSSRGIYNIYYVCQDCDDLMYVISKSKKNVLPFFEEFEKDFF